MGLVRDKVSPEEAAAVLLRDGGCVAPRLGATTPCRGRITLDHVPKKPGARRVSTRRWMVSVCEGHHLWEEWATSHRAEERDYLEDIYGPERQA